MAWLGWISEYWFSLLQTVGIVGSLLFAGASYRANARERRVQNLLELTKGHRAIWAQIYSNANLARVLDPHADLKHQPITRDEQIFVTSLILHLNSAHHVIRTGTLFPIEGLEDDVKQLFSLPIPANVWRRIRTTQNNDFVAYIDRATRSPMHTPFRSAR